MPRRRAVTRLPEREQRAQLPCAGRHQEGESTLRRSPKAYMRTTAVSTDSDISQALPLGFIFCAGQRECNRVLRRFGTASGCSACLEGGSPPGLVGA